MSVKYRIGYCPPNPGPNTKLKCKWYTNVFELLENYKEGDDVFVSHNGGRYIRTSIDSICENFYGESLNFYANNSILQM